MRIVVIIFVIFILASLASGLYYLVKDRSTTQRTAKALTVRIVLSLILFALLMLGLRFGFITTRL
jgi:Protein of unknown function (DUF2909)